MSDDQPITATYRLQLTPSFGFEQAAEVVPYLRDLGVSHLYLSPSLQARHGSQHGYDVTDPRQVSADLGGEAAFERLAGAGLPIVLDIVPNHMAADDDNPSWADVTTRARVFDLDPVTGLHRRFFTVDGLAGVRQEDPEVFERTHTKTLELVAAGLVSGLRVDHIDGLADPEGYLRRLHERAGVPIWVEKILRPGEQLPDWPVAGTTGYDHLADVDAVSMDPQAAGLATDLYRQLTGDDRPFADVAWEARRELVRGPFARDVARLRRDLGAGIDSDGLEDDLASLPVYRTYLRPEACRVTTTDRAVIERAGLHPWLEHVLLDDLDSHASFVTRFQQLSPGVMAKGIEDTAFYRSTRMLALNEVGNDPSRHSLTVDAFHEANIARQARFPFGLSTSTTHDTKRSADVRARLIVASNDPDEHAARLRTWFDVTAATAATCGVDDATRWLVFHTFLGAHDIGRNRMHEYLTKAVREAAVHTNWVDADIEWEAGLTRFVDHLWTDAAFIRSFEPYAHAVSAAGALLSLAHVLLRATCPGVPDTYQGDEVHNISLVDPDNRRPVGWGELQLALARIGGPRPLTAEDRKLFVLHRALLERRHAPVAFAGNYTPLAAGPSTIAFLRGDVYAVVVPLRPHRSATVDLPRGAWWNVLTESRHRVTGGRRLPVSDVVGASGVALLRRDTA
jgi:(1->4)-alpha-D-glucan 1-alpha-D-glucosylmutase